MKDHEREKIINLLANYYKSKAKKHGKEAARKMTVSLVKSGIVKKLLESDLDQLSHEDLESFSMHQKNSFRGGRNDKHK